MNARDQFEDQLWHPPAPTRAEPPVTGPVNGYLRYGLLGAIEALVNRWHKAKRQAQD